MEHRHNTDASFWIRCVGYTQRRESYFTIGKEYEVSSGGRVTNDRGYTYNDPRMKPDSDPARWYLSAWYEFEIVYDVAMPEHLELSFEDVMGYTK